MNRPKGSSGRKRHRPAIQVELPLPGPQGDVPPLEKPELPWWQQPWFIAALAALLALLLITTIYSQYAAHRDRARAAELDSTVKTLTFRAATRVRTLRIEPNRRSWSPVADAAIRRPEPPEELDLYFPVRYSDYRSFALFMDKVDHGRVMVIHRLRPDSNGDLRLAVNSSALGEGEFRIRLQGYTRLGQREDTGWVRFVIEPP